MTAIYLIRHAESTSAQTTPHQEWPLSPLGVRQSIALVPFLQRLGVAAVYSSPYKRALDTVGPLADAAELRVNTIGDLRERDLSPAMYADFQATVRHCFSNPSWSLDGGESNSALAARMFAALETIAVEQEGRVAVVASHGQAIATLLTSVNPEFGYEGWRAMGNPDVFRLEAVMGQFQWDGLSLRARIILPSP